MGNEYDKILEENIGEIIPAIAALLFGFKLKTSKPLTDKIQSTIEREPDFLEDVETEDDENFILHIEFQTQNDPMMPYRMMEYHAILVKIYKKEIRQYVVYLGAADLANVATAPPPEQMYKAFTAKKIRQLGYRKLLESNNPEELVLAILADFEGEPKEAAVRSIVERLRQVCRDSVILEKFLYQLGILSRIRKLDKVTYQIVESMPISIDITEDYLYQKALKVGLEKGLEQGLEKGREEGLHNAISNVLKKFPHYSDAEVAELMDVKINFVKRVRAELGKG